jgi:uncharacterized Zn finger protein
MKKLTNTQFTCPFCGKESQEVKRDSGKVVTYECSLCGSLTAAYLGEFHNLLRGFFNRHEMKTYKATPPDWVKTGKDG